MGRSQTLSDDDVLTDFVRQLRTRLGSQLKQIILYGSRARGDHAPDSDYDCLAIVDALHPGLKDTIFEVAGDFLFRHNAVFSVIPVAEDEYRRRVYNPLFMNVRGEGITM
jgi:predicted nucleotidyltransferase